jgi:hypothetical protein
MKDQVQSVRDETMADAIFENPRLAAIYDPLDGERDDLKLYADERLKPAGRVAFETRDPDQKAWKSWNQAESLTTTYIKEVGNVVSWNEVLDVSIPRRRCAYVGFDTAIPISGRCRA